MENQQSSDRQIKEMNDKNSRLERKIKRLEKEKAGQEIPEMEEESGRDEQKKELEERVD